MSRPLKTHPLTPVEKWARVVSGDKRGDGSLVSRVDALEAIDSIESSVGGEDGVDAPVDREGGEDGVARVEPIVGFVEVYPPLHVIGLKGVPPGEFGDSSRSFRRAAPIPRAPRPLVDELLEEIGAGLALQVAGRRPADDLAARLPVAMLAAEGVDEDRGVVQEAPHAPGHLPIGASRISRF